MIWETVADRCALCSSPSASDRLRAAAARQGRRHGRGVRQRRVGQPLRRGRLGQLPVADHGDPRHGVLPVEPRPHVSGDQSRGGAGSDAAGRDAESAGDGAEGAAICRSQPAPAAPAAPAPADRIESGGSTEIAAIGGKACRDRPKPGALGLPGANRPCSALTSRRGEIGRHAVLRGQWRKPWEFESPRRHQNDKAREREAGAGHCGDGSCCASRFDGAVVDTIMLEQYFPILLFILVGLAARGCSCSPSARCSRPTVPTRRSCPRTSAGSRLSRTRG